MKECRFVRKISPVDGYKIAITFDDGKKKIIDFEPFLDRGLMLELRDPEYFKRAKVKEGAITWPNTVDFCPDMLYEIGVEQE